MSVQTSTPTCSPSQKPPRPFYTRQTIPSVDGRGDSTSSTSGSCFPSPRKNTLSPPMASTEALSSAGVSAHSSSVDCLHRIPCLTTTAKKQLTVRALFDYDPATDTGLPGRGLAFHHGDILHVLNASDPEWWQARRLVRPPDATHTKLSDSVQSIHCPLGIIPSRQRIERRQRSRLKHVNFFSKVTVIGSAASSIPPPAHDVVPDSSNVPTTTATVNGQHEDVFHGGNSTLDRLKRSAQSDLESKSRSNSLTRNFLKRFSSRNRRKIDSALLSGANSVDNTISEADLDSIRSYDLVKPVTIQMARPLLVYGPLKERILDNLLRSSRFATCVPHTSRPPRQGEREGVEYHFVPSQSQMEELIKSDCFIEVGQFQDHFYATSIESVRRTLQTGRVCVLDVSLTAVRRLELAGLHPISILVKPRSVQHLRNIQNRLTEDQAKRSVDLALRLEADNWRLFSAILTFETIEDAVSQIKQFVHLHSGPVIWVSSGNDSAIPTDHSKTNSNLSMG